LLQALPAAGAGWEQELRGRIKTRLQVLHGQGSWTQSLESGGRRLFREMIQPAPLLAFGLSSLAFRGVRLLALNRLRLSSSAGFVTRAIGARNTASLWGMASESLVWPLAQVGCKYLFAGSAESRGFLEEWASGALLLGPLRLAGGVSRRLVERVPAALGHSPRAFLEGIGSYAGILFGQKLDGLLHSNPDPAPFLTGLFTFLQAHAGNTLARGIWGPGLTRLERSWDAGARDVISSSQGKIGQALAWANSVSTSSPFKPATRSSSGDLVRMAPYGGAPEMTATTPPRQVPHGEIPFRKGRLHVELLTRKTFTPSGLARRLKSRGEVVSGYLLGYRHWQINLNGAVAKLLWADRILSEELVSHLEAGNRLVAQMDLGANALKRVFVLNPDGMPKILLLQPISEDYALRMDLDFSQSELPKVTGRKYIFAPESQTLPPALELRQTAWHHIPGTESAAVEMTLTPSGKNSRFSDEAIFFEVHQHSQIWKISTAVGEKLLSLNPERFQGALRGHFIGEGEVQKVSGRRPYRRPTRQKQSTLPASLSTPDKTSLKQIFEFPDGGQELFANWFRGSDSRTRVALCRKISAFLVSETPAHRAQAFNILRNNLEIMDTVGLRYLRRFLQQRLSKSQYPPDQRYMVVQVEAFISELLSRR
jgi:hypothetical protein